MGDQSCGVTSIAPEPTSVRHKVGPDLTKLDFSFKCTNFVVQPSGLSDTSIGYVCILTRIISFKVARDDAFWGMNADRSIICSQDDDEAVCSEIRRFVGARIKLKEATDAEGTKPTRQDEDEQNA